jgi:D-beta-D-heptose 7-phosphate kinase/D-beta-D-heptose 1-phosphate adenosyltransferase
VRALKGAERPVYSSQDRARILAALEMVDYVVLFDETRAERIIRSVRPNILIKGEDWRDQRVDGQSFVEAHGGRVVLAPLLAGHSTSATIARLRGGASDGATGTAPASTPAATAPAGRPPRA